MVHSSLIENYQLVSMQYSNYLLSLRYKVLAKTSYSEVFPFPRIIGCLSDAANDLCTALASRHHITLYHISYLHTAQPLIPFEERRHKAHICLLQHLHNLIALCIHMGRWCRWCVWCVRALEKLCTDRTCHLNVYVEIGICDWSMNSNWLSKY